MEDHLSIKLVDLWIKIFNNCYDDDYTQICVFIHDIIKDYCTYNVTESRTTEYFNETIRSYKKFQKYTNARFDPFKAIFKQNME